MTIYIVVRHTEIQDSICVSKCISAFDNIDQAHKLCHYLNEQEELDSKRFYSVEQVEMLPHRTDLILPKQ